jgi:predicted transcriptional regulator
MTDSDNPGADARRKYEDEAFIEAVRESQPASTSEVGERVGCPRRTADYRLRKLRDEGQVDSKMAGNSLIWFLTDE